MCIEDGVKEGMTGTEILDSFALRIPDPGVGPE
jgi:hypothetical protein